MSILNFQTWKLIETWTIEKIVFAKIYLKTSKRLYFLCLRIYYRILEIIIDTPKKTSEGQTSTIYKIKAAVVNI